MIRVEFLEPNTATWRKWRTDCASATQELIAAVGRGEEVQINEDLYKRKSIRKEVYFSKQGPFRGKCAYCECVIRDLRDGDIDHYRPKRLITGADDKPIILIGLNGQPLAHRGYYWLAYDWENLLPSCKFCNQPSMECGKSLGKRNRFPVDGDHAVSPGDEAQEHPFLLHPVRDNPNEHLGVNTSTGMLKYLTERGRVTIQVIGLNERDGLPEERRKAIDHVKALLDKVIHSDIESERQDALNQLHEIKSGVKPFALAALSYLAERPVFNI